MTETKDLWRFFPHTYARVASGKKWERYKHLEYLSNKITPAISKGGGRFIVNMPPRHGKSEFISKWLPAWYLDNFPEKNIILTSYGDELASGFGRWVRNHLEANEFSKAKLTIDSTAANRFDTTLGGSMITAGVGGSITGRGGHLLICDDPIKNYEEASSGVYRQRLKDWFDTTFYTRQEPGASIILLMTRWHHDDLAGYLINDHNDKWDVISLPGLAEESDKIGRSVGEALCPERYDKEALLKIKEGLPDQHWLSLYQQRPTKEGGEIFKREWWQFYDEAPRNFTHTVQFWDTAQKPGLTNDYTVCATWAKTQSGFYLLDIFRKKLEAPDIEQALIQQFNKWKPNAVSIEDKSSGSSIIQYARRSTTIPIIPYNPGQKDKETRAISATPTIRSGNCFLPRNAPWLSDFLVEHEQFPAAAHDDQVDTTSQMVEYFNNLSTFNPRVRSL
jgi:predicted phage terminase large subunit-like protein